MGINSFQAPASPIDAISKALGVAASIYGIKHASAAQDLLNAQTAEQTQKTQQEGIQNAATQANLANLQNPDSTESQLAKSEGSALVGYLKQSKAYKQNPKDIDNLEKLISDPKTSGYQVQNSIANSPLLKDIVQSNNKDESLQYMAAALNNRNANTQEKTELAENKDYRREMAPYEGTIQAANRANAIIDQIKSGGLKSTPTLRNDLNAAVGSMFNNGKGATVYGMSHSDMGSLEGRINQGIGYVTGTAQDTLAPEQLDQLQRDIGALKNEYSSAHQIQFDSYKAGLPDRLVPKAEARFNQFRKSAGLDNPQSSPDSFNIGVGAANAGGGAPPAGPHGATVIQGGHSYNWNPTTKKYE